MCELTRNKIMVAQQKLIQALEFFYRGVEGPPGADALRAPCGEGGSARGQNLHIRRGDGEEMLLPFEEVLSANLSFFCATER